MDLGTIFEIATDPTFRELSNFITPPRAGKVTAIEGSGQVRVESDDPDGGDVLAWPLDVFQYAVSDVVYVQFGVNNPDSAIVVGSKGSVLPGLRANWDIGEDRRILAEALRARDAEGLRLEDNAGNLGIFIEDGGNVGFGTTDPTAKLDMVVDGGGASAIATSYREATGGGSFTLRHARGSLASPSTLVAGDQLGQFLFQGWDGSDWNMAAGLRAHMDGADSTRFEMVVRNAGTNIDPAVTLKSDGKFGIGVTAPQGILHVHDGIGGAALITKTGVVGSSVVMVPNGAGDVTKTVNLMGIVYHSAGLAAANISIRVDNSSNQNYDDGGGNRIVFTVAANGELSVARTVGTATWGLTLWCVWQ